MDLAGASGPFLENMDTFFQNLEGSIGMPAASSTHQPPRGATNPRGGPRNAIGQQATLGDMGPAAANPIDVHVGIHS